MKQDQGLGPSFLSNEDISACTYMSTIDARQFQMPFLGLVINCNLKKKIGLLPRVAPAKFSKNK